MVYYDETSTSCLRWKKDIYRKDGIRAKISAGDVAGSYGRYYTVCINYIFYRVHRIIAVLHGYTVGESDIVDHLDGDSMNNNISNLRVTSRSSNMKNRKIPSSNKSGYIGVCTKKKVISGECYFYITATWSDLCGKKCSKGFSVQIHGYEEALRLACEYRDKMIKELNEQGAGYTERHGAESSKVDSLDFVQYNTSNT